MFSKGFFPRKKSWLCGRALTVPQHNLEFSDISAITEYIYVNLLANNKIWDGPKFTGFVDNKTREENLMGTREVAGLPAIFSKTLFLRVVQSLGYVIQG